MRHILAATILFFIAAPQAFAQTDTAQPDNIEFDGQTWRIAAKNAEIKQHLGRQALALTGGRLWADDIAFEDGVISFDAAYDEQLIFIGAGWRAASDEHFEEMYFRGHLNNKPDALQYTPVENGISAWQIFSDGNGIAPVSQKYGGWNKVKIVVMGDRADIYFNSAKPVLHIPDLKTSLLKGGVSLRSSGRNAGPAYFSNIAIRPLQSGEGIAGQPKPSAKLPAGLISSWEVSPPFDEAEIADTLALDDSTPDSHSWAKIIVETNGIANLAKLSGAKKGRNTVFVRMKIDSATAQMKELRFGYSDRVRIYLNGKRVYFGNAGWRTRNYRFLGTVGFYDSVGLDLKKGENILLAAVSETFGGWAWAGAIENQENISFSE